MKSMTAINSMVFYTPIRPGLVPADGWYTADIISVDGTNGTEPRVRFTLLLDTGHLAWISFNLSHDPNSRLVQFWASCIGDPEEIVLASAVGKKLRVFIEKSAGINMVKDIIPIGGA